MCFDTPFRAPEMKYLSRNLTNKVDIYSVGAVLLEMLISHSINHLEKISAFEDVSIGLFPEVMDANITLMLKKSFDRNPCKRSSANEILNELQKYV
ncbi:hypothetical protein LIER_02327 [Lithospermum erythrorhizon]|uniref:Protein kinase domain-containing protein n=1 Tax=Lithospermum erythrorhizon TaxID=34254 RepID=A0AAV3NTM9_LITER